MRMGLSVVRVWGQQMEDNQLACVKQVIHLQYRIDFVFIPI
jgi:hypothetical protein